MFDMVVMIEHIGSYSTQDHFVSYILNNKRWYKMDDSLVDCTSDDNNYLKVYHMNLDEILKRRPIY